MQGGQAEKRGPGSHTWMPRLKVLLLGCWGARVLGCWGAGVHGYRGAGVLGCKGAGLPGCWGAGALGCWGAAQACGLGCPPCKLLCSAEDRLGGSSAYCSNSVPSSELSYPFYHKVGTYPFHPPHSVRMPPAASLALFHPCILNPLPSTPATLPSPPQTPPPLAPPPTPIFWQCGRRRRS